MDNVRKDKKNTGIKRQTEKERSLVKKIFIGLIIWLSILTKYSTWFVGDAGLNIYLLFTFP